MKMIIIIALNGQRYLSVAIDRVRSKGTESTITKVLSVSARNRSHNTLFYFFVFFWRPASTRPCIIGYYISPSLYPLLNYRPSCISISLFLPPQTFGPRGRSERTEEAEAETIDRDNQKRIAVKVGRTGHRPHEHTYT